MKMITAVVFAVLATAVLADSDQHIVGGRDVATPGAWPWQGSLEYFGSHSCGCSLISTTWVLTAAHCVSTSTSPYSVVFGLHDRVGKKQGSPVVYKLAQIIRHNRYNVGTGAYPNDIAVMKTTVAVETNDFVSTVSLASGDMTFVGSTCMITGWGRTCGSCPLPDILQEVQINVIAQDTCKSQWGTNINDGHICVKGAGIGSCNGDSGGPLVCFVGDEWIQAGLTSWGYRGCNTDFPSVYSRITFFRTWITENTGV